jgi:hypothetical protein
MLRENNPLLPCGCMSLVSRSRRERTSVNVDATRQSRRVGVPETCSTVITRCRLRPSESLPSRHCCHVLQSALTLVHSCFVSRPEEIEKATVCFELACQAELRDASFFVTRSMTLAQGRLPPPLDFIPPFPTLLQLTLNPADPQSLAFSKEPDDVASTTTTWVRHRITENWVFWKLRMC